LNYKPKTIVKTLTSGRTKAVLSTNGGCVQRFLVNDLDILYPETLLEINGQTKKRGGVPILFPWAGALENYPQHGFARDMEWKVIDQESNEILLGLKDNEQTFKIFPYHFRNGLKIELNEKRMFLSVSCF